MNKKFKAFQIIEVSNVLAEIAKKEVSLKVAIEVGEIIEKFSTSNDIITKKRQTIIEKYGKKDDDGNLKQDDKGNVEITDVKAFMEDMNDMLNTEVEIDFKPIEKEIVEKEDIKITPQQYLSLKLVIKNDEENIEKVEGEIVK